jgi:hypothetical protein
MTSPMKKGQGLNWNPAAVELPEIPTIQAGQDALSSTIAAVLPTLAVPLAANVATLQAKEGTFAGRLRAAEAAYQTSDDQGSQAVGQVVGMLGQMGQQAGQMAQQAGAPVQAAGGQMGTFGSMMQQAMQAAQGAGGRSAGGQGAGAPAGAAQGLTGVGGGQQPPNNSLEQRVERLEQRVEREDRSEDQQEPQRDERQPLQSADDSSLAAEPERGGPAAGHVPVTPPEPRQSVDDVARSL